jgi:hypothetical protein
VSAHEQQALINPQTTLMNEIVSSFFKLKEEQRVDEQQRQAWR